jgi:hypothetical protein
MCGFQILTEEDSGQLHGIFVVDKVALWHIYPAVIQHSCACHFTYTFSHLYLLQIRGTGLVLSRDSCDMGLRNFAGLTRKIINLVPWETLRNQCNNSSGCRNHKT